MAEATDLAEDEEYGGDKRGDEGPRELARRETRLVKMRTAKEVIEAEARRKAADKAEADGADGAVVAEATAQAAASARPTDKAQRSFTDPEARMMKTVDGFQYAYDAQAVVDEHSQVIVTTDVTRQADDVGQLIPMIGATKDSLTDAGIEDTPKVILADAGYCSQDNLQRLTDMEVNALVATGKIRHNEKVPDAPTGRIPKDATQRERMARQLRAKPGRVDYARRKAIVEPVFGQMNTRQNTKHLRLRGLTGVKGEWTLHAICHNLRELANAANTVPQPST